MREDHIEYGLDATSKTYYHRSGPDMAAVRMARFGLNRRHFPNHSASFLDRHPEAAPLPSPLLQRGRSALERATDHFLFLVSLTSPLTDEERSTKLHWANEQLAECNALLEVAAYNAAHADPYVDVETGERITSPEMHKLIEATARVADARKRVASLSQPAPSAATIAAARGEVRRIAAKLADIEERPTRNVADVDVPKLVAQYKAEIADVSGRIKRARQHVPGPRNTALIEELQAERIQLQTFVSALQRRMPAPTERPSSNRPERCCLVSQTMVVGSFDETNPTEPIGYAVYEVPDYEWEPGHVAPAFFVTQFVYKNVNVRNDAEVHKLNRSYLMGGEPMLYPPKSKSYRVMEPAESYHGPFAHADEAEQVAANWKSECLDIYNDSDRILGWDVEPV